MVLKPLIVKDTMVMFWRCSSTMMESPLAYVEPLVVGYVIYVCLVAKVMDGVVGGGVYEGIRGKI